MTKRISKKPILLVAIILASSILTVLLPERTYARSIDSIKDALYAKVAVESCLSRSDYHLKETVNNGENLDSIIENLDDATIDTQQDVGQWINGTRQYVGQMSCRNLIKKVLSGTIDSISILGGGILDNVYEKKTTIYSLTCSYYVWNDKEDQHLDDIYNFPSGYYGNAISNNPTKIISDFKFYYDTENGQFVDKYPPNDDRYVMMEAIKEVYGSGGMDINDPSGSCKPYVSQFGLQNKGLFRKDMAYGVDSNTIFGVWEPEESGNMLTVAGRDAMQALRNNIKRKYNYDTILNSNEAKYLIYGRMLFNGDGGFPYGCKGISALNHPDIIEALAKQSSSWDSSLSYIVRTDAYIDGTRQGLITKIGADDRNGTGVDPSSISVTPLPGQTVNCAEIINIFNGVGNLDRTNNNNAEIISAVESYINPIKALEEGSLPPVVTPVDTQDAGQVKDEECYRHAKSLGWIICPIINGMHEVVTNIYDQVEPLIAINDSIVDDIGNENGGVYWAWITFRNLANIAFIVFFMIVIFSQLTGYGIDNYGVKKLLPKLIVTAILVNLSYFIISILVDLSNIVGTGIQGLFKSIPIVASDGGSGNIATGFKTITGVIVSWIGIGAAGAAAVTFGGWALIIPILLYLLSAAVSLLFGFIVLGLRQAVVIILIAISPLALVLIALPNTEKLFKRYTDLLKGVLVVYPIIGALIGAGTFASALLMRGTEHGFIMTLIGGLLCVIPYLLIPSLTRRSLDAMGNIGARLGQMGQNLGRGLSRGVGNLEPVKNLNEDWKERQSTRNANRWLQTRRGIEAAAAVKEGRATPRQAKQYKRYVTAAGADKAASIAARGAQASFDRLSSDAGYAAALAGINKKENEQLIKDQDALFEDQGIYNNLNSFQNEIEKAFANDDTIALEALMKKATDGSDAQRERLSRAVDNSLRSGSMGTKAATAYASHIASNGIYKGKNRSQDRQASKIMESINDGSFGETLKNAKGRKEMTRAYYASEAFKSGKLSPEAVFNMEDGEFNTLRAAANSEDHILSGTDRSTMVSTLQGALDAYNNDTNNTYKKSVKPETITQIEDTLKALRQIDVSHEPTAGPAPGRDERRDSADFDESGF